MTMKKLFIYLPFLLVLQAPAMAQSTGIMFPTREQLRRVPYLRTKAGGGPTALPPAINLSGSLPRPGDQGRQESCTAWAVCYGAVTYNKKRQHRWPLYTSAGELSKAHVYSPAYIYNQLNTDENCGKGIFLTDALNAVRDQGVCSLLDMDYAAGCLASAIPFRGAAAQNRILSYYKIFDGFADDRSALSTDAIKAALNDSTPVVMGINYDSSFYTNVYGDRHGAPPYIWDNFHADCAPQRCYHAVLCIGYDDGKNAFKILNSWGTSRWGDSGYGWISYDVMRQALWEAYATENLADENLVAATSIDREIVARPEIAITGSFDNKLPVGSYNQFDNLQVGCVYLDKKAGYAIMRIADTTAQNNNVLTFKINTNEEKVVTYGDVSLDISLDKIKSPLFSRKKAAYNYVQSINSR
jgi:hypothetical protein